MNYRSMITFANNRFGTYALTSSRGKRDAHETTDAPTLPCHACTPPGCKSADVKRTIIEKNPCLLPLLLFPIPLESSHGLLSILYSPPPLPPLPP